MPIPKPYYRILRPNIQNQHSTWAAYATDTRYADDRILLCRAYRLLENDIKRLFEFVEPSADNLSAYSHRSYEILLRASTEFETHCKRILVSNGYRRRGNLNITDYHKINRSSKLAEYEVSLNVWHPTRWVFNPLAQWNAGHSIDWYGAYNQVKHDRHLNFSAASLENVVKAVASVFVVLFSQFGVDSFDAYQDVQLSLDGSGGHEWYSEGLFSIKAPQTWTAADQYDFDWDTIKLQPTPFDRYTF